MARQTMTAHSEFQCACCFEWVDEAGSKCVRCQSDPFPDDTMIRRWCAYIIWWRVGQRLVIWRDRAGVDYTHAEAVAIARRRREEKEGRKK